MAYRTNLYQVTTIPIIPGLISTILFFGPLLSGQAGFRSNPIGANVVTFRQLQHKVPKAAQKEMEKATKARLKHLRDNEAEHLKNAVRFDPEYVAARNDLAVCLLRSDPASALAQLEKAIEIDPHEAVLFHNLAVGYIITNKLDVAERAARNAVDLDRTNNRTRFVLGYILVQEEKYTAEALADAQSAIQEYPFAGLVAAEVLIKQNKLSKARLYLDGYLSSGDQGHREFAERWIHYIDQSLATSAANLPSPLLPVPR